VNPEFLAPAMMIASGSIHAIVNAIVKGGRDKMAARAMTDGSAAAILLPALLLVPLPAGAWGWLAATAAVHALYLYALIRAYQVSDFSSAYPVLRGTAPLVTAGVTLGLLGEHVSTAAIVGIALIGVSMFVLALGRHLGRAGFGWAVLTGFTIAAYTVTDGFGVRAAGPTFEHRLAYIAWLCVLEGPWLLVLALALRPETALAHLRRYWWRGAIGGVIASTGYGIAIYALVLGVMAHVAALRETSVLFAAVIGTLMLKERFRPQRAAGTVAIVAGVMALRFG